MATVFQTKEWENFKLSTGWRKSWRIFDILILERKIPLLGSMLYAPMLSHDQTKLSMQNIFLDQIRKIAGENNSIFFRMESDDEADGNINPEKSAYSKSFEEMQPEHTLLIDLSKPLDQILAEMKPKGRYNIKVAEKYKIKIAPGKIEDFYPLYRQMAKRAKISFRNITYFQKLLDFLAPKDYLLVYNAKTPEGRILASAILVFYKDVCTYLFGGSSDDEREKMAPYLLHFEVIKEAKKRRCRYYDLFGIAPNGDETRLASGLPRRKHPWAGVTRFKKQFGGQEFSSLGSWDLVFSPAKYWLFKIAEKIRR